MGMLFLPLDTGGTSGAYGFNGSMKCVRSAHSCRNATKPSNVRQNSRISENSELLAEPLPFESFEECRARLRRIYTQT